MKTSIIGWIILILTQFTISASAQDNVDRSAADGTKFRLHTINELLNYPKTVERYYQSKGFKLSWVAKSRHNPNAETAMMFLDCVSQFGLNPIDYHRDQLLYQKLQELSENPNPLVEGQRTVFDVLLTDAIITAMNQLHYGKFNPFYSQNVIDNGNLPDFNSDVVLFGMIDARDFYAMLMKVQPDNSDYVALQRNMQLVLGQYILDSYEYPKVNVRKMAINMERLRWLSATAGNSIQVNIPSYRLKLVVGNSIKIFKVIVGKPENPTQTFESRLTRFTAAPEWKVPAELFVAEILPAALNNVNYLNENRYSIFDNQHRRMKINRRKLIKISQNPAAYTARKAYSADNTHGSVLFRIDERPDLSLYDHGDVKAFNAKDRATSKGFLQVEDPERLARFLLIADGAEDQVPFLESALKTYQYKNFYLKKPIPIAVTYLTSEMIDSRLVIYKDIYQKDVELESKLFGELQLRLEDRKITKKNK